MNEQIQVGEIYFEVMFVVAIEIVFAPLTRGTIARRRSPRARPLPRKTWERNA